MSRPLVLVRRRRSDHPLDELSLGDVLQRLAVLNPDKLCAVGLLAREALLDEIAARQKAALLRTRYPKTGFGG